MMQFASVSIAAVDYGGYVNLLKLLPVILVMLVWGRLLTWADKDAVAAHLPREWLNFGLFGAGLLGFGLFFFLPGFWIALGGLMVVMLGSAGTYLAMRHQKVGLGDLKKEMAKAFSSGKKKKVEAKAGQITFAAKNGNVLPIPEAEDPGRMGYDAAQAFLTDPIRKEAERVEVRPTADGGCAVQYVVDGVAYNAPAMDRTSAAEGITYMKKGAKLEVEDRRKPQTGMMRGTLDGNRHELEVTTAGSTAGESMRVVIDPKKRSEVRIDGMGMSADQLAMIKAFIADPRGIVLVSAPRQQGLTTMLYSILKAHDAFLTHIQTIERVAAEDLEGITQNKLGAGVTPQEELKQVEWVSSQEPDILMIDEITNPASARELIRFAGEGKGRRVYVGMRAGTTFDALNLWRKLVGNDADAVNVLGLAVAGRVLRKLCMACKVGYTPDPDTLRKLNMDPGRVTMLYQARTEPLRDPKGNPIPCSFCHDLRYKGRFGVYEVLYMDDEVRQAVAEGGSVNQLKTVFRKQRGRYLQELALAQVEAGETSVQEVLRVLRSESASAKR